MALKATRVSVTFTVWMTTWNDGVSAEEMFDGADVVLADERDTYGEINEVEVDNVVVLDVARNVTCTNTKCEQQHAYECDVDLFPNAAEIEEAALSGQPYIMGTCKACGAHVYREKE